MAIVGWSLAVGFSLLAVHAWMTGMALTITPNGDLSQPPADVQGAIMAAIAPIIMTGLAVFTSSTFGHS